MVDYTYITFAGITDVTVADDLSAYGRTTSETVLAEVLSATAVTI